MRELLFKNITSWKDNKRDVIVEETVRKNGILAKTTRRCLYFVKEKVRIDDPKDLKRIAARKIASSKANRHFHVLKERNVKSGTDKLMCKVGGTFYAIIKNYLYCIVFIHTFKLSFMTADRKK